MVSAEGEPEREKIQSWNKIVNLICVFMVVFIGLILHQCILIFFDIFVGGGFVSLGEREPWYLLETRLLEQLSYKGLTDPLCGGRVGSKAVMRPVHFQLSFHKKSGFSF